MSLFSFPAACFKCHDWEDAGVPDLKRWGGGKGGDEELKHPLLQVGGQTRLGRVRVGLGEGPGDRRGGPMQVLCVLGGSLETWQGGQGKWMALTGTERLGLGEAGVCGGSEQGSGGVRVRACPWPRRQRLDAAI